LNYLIDRPYRHRETRLSACDTDCITMGYARKQNYCKIDKLGMMLEGLCHRVERFPHDREDEASCLAQLAYVPN